MGFARAPTAVVLLVLLSGCKTTSAAALYGDRAEYSRDYRGYVIRRNASSDGYLLYEPILQRKVQCREEIEPWLRAWSEAIPQNVSDSAWDNNSNGIMLPFTAAAILVGVVFAVPYLPTRIPYEAARGKSADALFDEAMNDFRASRYDRAANELENALLRPGLDAGRGQYLYYYLGLSYEQLGRRELAVAALNRFLETSPSWGTQRYDVAEVRLILAGQAPTRCRSQDPVTIPWK